MTAKRLTPAMMRAMEPYLEDLIADWMMRAEGKHPGRACALCRVAMPCPVFDCSTGRRSCFYYFPEALACYSCKTHREGSIYAAVVLTQLEEIRDWLKAQREKGATGDG